MSVPESDITTQQHIQYLRKMDDLSREMTADYQKNIDIVVKYTNELLSGVCSLYNKLDNRDQSLVCWAKENTPPDLPKKDNAKGHICYEATIKGQDKVVSISDISKTDYQHTDPYVNRYGLKSYLGFPVKIGDKSLGSLCVVDTKNRKFSDLEIAIIEHLANIIRLQEENLKIQNIQTVLYKIARTLLTSKDLNDLCIQIKQNLSTIVDSSNLTISLINENSDLITYRYDDVSSENTCNEEYLIDKVIKVKKPVLLNRDEIISIIPEKINPEEICISWLGMPLMIREKLIGVISLKSCNQYVFLPEDINLLEFVSFEIAHILNEKQLKEALEKKEEEYRSVVNHTAIGIYRTDFEGNILFVNDMLVKMLEYETAEEVLNIDLNKTFHPDYKREYFIESLIKHKIVTNKETIWTTKSGKQIYVREIARLIETESREIIEGTVENITEEVRSRNAYKFEKERLDDLITTVPIGILQIDENDNIIFANEEFEKISGYSSAEFKHVGHLYEKLLDIEKLPVKNIDQKSSVRILIDTRNQQKYVKISKTKAIEGTYIISVEDITTSILSQNELYEQSKYLTALNLISNKLLSEKILPYQQIMEIMGSTLNVSQVSLYRSFQLVEKNEVQIMAQWINPEITKQSIPLQKLQFDNLEASFPNWIKKLNECEYMYGSADDFLYPEKEFMNKQHIHSIFVHVIRVNEAPFGVLVLNNYNIQQKWSERDIMFIQTVANNISEVATQKLMNTRLKNSRTSYEELFKNSSSGIVIFSKKGKIENINPTAEMMFDCQHDQLVGETIDRLTDNRIIAENIDNAIKFCNTVNSTKKMDVIVGEDEDLKALDLTFKKILYFDKSCVIMYAHDVTLRYKKEIEIRTNLNEKQTLLQEIHHRVKNNLQVISSLLNLQLKDVETENDKALFLDSQNRIRSIALIHESLYNSHNLSRINFHSYTEQLLTRLFTIFQISSYRIIYQLDISNIELNIKKAIPCGLILDELITNSLKYAFPENRKGKISISFKKYDNNYFLSVKDNGVGFESKNILSNKTTLGFELITTLTQQLSGNFRIIDDNGFGIEISFPE